MIYVVVVFDTNVMIKVYLHRHVLRDTSPFTEIYDGLMSGTIIPVYSRAMMNELLWKLTNKCELTQRFQIDPQHAREFVEGVYYELGDFAVTSGREGKSSDPKDWMFEEAATVGGEEVGRPGFLVSDDEDLHEYDVIDSLKRLGVTVLWSWEFGTKIPPSEPEAPEAEEPVV